VPCYCTLSNQESSLSLSSLLPTPHWPVSILESMLCMTQGGRSLMLNQRSDKDRCPEERRDEGPLCPSTKVFVPPCLP
jgi:hypothetical protein